MKKTGFYIIKDSFFDDMDDVVLLCDTNHILTSDYSEVIVVGAGADAVDYSLNP